MSFSHYAIYRSTSSSGPFTTVGTSTSASFVDHSAEEGVIYYYYIVVVDQYGIHSYPSEQVIPAIPEVEEPSGPMAPRITPVFYRLISDLYGAFEELQEDKNSFLEEAHTSVVLLNDEEAKLDLLRDFRDTQQIEAERQPVETLSAVKKINNHVITRGGYFSLNEYLENTGIMVCPPWAFLSGLAGFEIDPIHIRSGSCLGAEVSESSAAGQISESLLDILTLWPPFAD